MTTWTTSAVPAQLEMEMESAWAPFTRACAAFMAVNHCPNCGMDNDPKCIMGRDATYQCAACGSWYSQRVGEQS